MLESFNKAPWRHVMVLDMVLSPFVFRGLCKLRGQLPGITKAFNNHYKWHTLLTEPFRFDFAGFSSRIDSRCFAKRSTNNISAWSNCSSQLYNCAQHTHTLTKLTSAHTREAKSERATAKTCLRHGLLLGSLGKWNWCCFRNSRPGLLRTFASHFDLIFH